MCYLSSLNIEIKKKVESNDKFKMFISVSREKKWYDVRNDYFILDSAVIWQKICLNEWKTLNIF
jgi:hypothetical protein